MGEEDISIKEEQVKIHVSEASVNIEAIEESTETSVENPVQVINVVMQEPMNISMEESFVPIGELNENSNHELLSGRDQPNQHPISAITGLEPRLSNLETIGQEHSTKENIANYYKWNDGNPQSENRCGLFVSFVQGTNNIAVSTSSAVGVTISKTDTGFIGNDTQSGRGADYGLVCTNGKVKVRALSTVSAGDRVIPDVGGLAKKSTNDYGYDVIAIENDTGTYYAVICLAPQAIDLYKLSGDIDDVQDNLNEAQANINTVINTANTALQNSLNTAVGQINGQITVIQGQVQTATQTANEASTIASGANTAAALASSIATAAQTTATSIQNQVTTDLATMEEDIEDLIDSVEPLTTWEGPNGTTGASYLIDHIQNNLATKTEVSTVNTRVDSAFTAVQQNAKQLQTIALVEQKYSVGPHSPSDGLIYDDAADNAIDAIPIGMIYVPTVDVIDTRADGTHLFSFTQGNAYEWNGLSWDMHEDCAIINGENAHSYYNGSAQIKYWYVGDTDITHNNTIYPAGSLCLWLDNIWIVVANIEDYRQFHISSRAYQTANELGAEIADARGDSVSLGLRIEDNESSINTLVTHQGEIDDSMALLQATASEHEAAIYNAIMVNGAILINTLAMDASPTGNEFYGTEPTWNNGWTFANSYVTVAPSPCWAKYPNDNTKYYKYIISANNKWTRYTYKYNTNLASIKQTADNNSTSISAIVSNIGADGTVTAASIVEAVNTDSSEISMSADRIKLSGGTIDLATGKFKITANNGFELNENGIVWNTTNNPTKIVYSQVLVNKPANNTQYSAFANSSTVTWHKTVTSADKYASETTDGGATWSEVRKIVGDDAITITPQPSTLYFRCNSNGTFNDNATKSFTFNVSSGSAYTIKTFETVTGYTITKDGTALKVTPSGVTTHESDNIQVVVTVNGIDYYVTVTLAKIYDGKDAMTLNVYSTNGSTFKVGDIATLLYAVVRRGTTDVTLQIPYTSFVWTKIDAQGNAVNNWTPTYAYEGRHDTIILTNVDVYERATFECQINE